MLREDALLERNYEKENFKDGRELRKSECSIFHHRASVIDSGAVN